MESTVQLIFQAQTFMGQIYLESPTAPPSALDFILHSILQS